MRSRLAIAVLLGQLVLLVAGTLAAHRAGTRALEQQFDSALLTQASVLASQLEQRGNHVGVELDETFMSEYFDEESPDYFELFYQGIAFGRSPALGEEDLPLRAGSLSAPEIWNASLPDGRPGRLIGLEVEVPEVEADPETGVLPDPATVSLVLGKDRQRLEQLGQALLLGLIIADGVLLLGGLLVLWATVTLCLRPMRQFVREVEQVDAETLGVDIDPAQVPLEFQPVVASVNQLLHRLDAALRSERRAASNMAHELMTPISELRTLSEVALQDGSDEAYRDHALGMAHDISIQMANLIRMVRQLTAVDAPTQHLAAESLPLAPLVERLVGLHAKEADAKSLEVSVNVNGEALQCNSDALNSVLNNLLGNAVEYTPPGGQIELSSFATDSRVTLRLSNECQGLCREDLEHLTEPFWRLSSSRSESDHYGLGLTIAQGMATLAGLELQMSLEDQRFVVEASGPRAES